MLILFSHVRYKWDKAGLTFQMNLRLSSLFGLSWNVSYIYFTLAAVKYRRNVTNIEEFSTVMSTSALQTVRIHVDFLLGYIYRARLFGTCFWPVGIPKLDVGAESTAEVKNDPTTIVLCVPIMRRAQSLRPHARSVHTRGNLSLNWGSEWAAAARQVTLLGVLHP